MTRRGHLPNETASGLTALMALVLSVLATSCWHPTFDPMLSASEATVRKLGDPTEYFAVENVQQWGLDNAWFLPPMVDTPTMGSLVMDMDDIIEFKQVWIDAFNHSGSINTTTGFNANNALGDAYLVQSTPNGDAKAFIATNTATGYYLDWTTNPVASIPATIPATIGPFGIGTVSVSGFGQSSLACFAYDGTPRYQIFNAWTGGDPGFAATPAALTLSAASQVTVPGKFLATTAWLYLSCGLADGSRAIYRWPNPPLAMEPTRYPEDFGPLIGALSDGRLLAERDGIISVLDANLVRLFKFPAGTLRFVHERYDGTDVPPRMKVVFTRTLFVRTSTHDDIGTLKVEVYEIPTADLANLAD